MEFDEVEYLEKTVEEADDREGSRNKKREGNEKTERSYRKRGIDGELDSGDRKGKRSRGDEEENGHEKSGREKDRDRHRRDKGQDGERDRDRERNTREMERDGERHRDRDRDRERSHREKDKERERRDKEKEREREKEKAREKEREKERERREMREKEKEKEREEDRDGRERSRSRSKSRRYESDREREREREREFETRESRRFKEKKEAEPEADPERDQRTVFAYQMPLKATERDVYEFFSQAGKVRDVRLIMDRNSRRSKGVGYIEFFDVMSVPMAIALSGQLLFGQPVMVKPSEAEKNLVQSNTSTGGTGGGSGLFGPIDRKLYVGNLHFNMTELQLRKIFEPYGTVELVQMPLDLETGQCKGFGFVQFAQVESAKCAQSELNGKLEIGGRTIKVSSVTEQSAHLDTATKSADLDDDEGGGLTLNAQSRALLMQKLDRTGIATSIAGTLGIPVLNSSAPNQQAMSIPIQAAQVYPSPAFEPIGQPSECLLLKNMFDPATETDPEFDLDIKEDVEEECSKYGRVKHIHVDRNSAGFVYLQFESVEAAARAQRAMHLRWFAQRSISAIFMQPLEYEAKFRNEG